VSIGDRKGSQSVKDLSLKFFLDRLLEDPRVPVENLKQWTCYSKTMMFFSYMTFDETVLFRMLLLLYFTLYNLFYSLFQLHYVFCSVLMCQ